ncbi:type III secretion system protein [Pectobacterium carotovorum]|uniref:Type III secretion system protein n=1 Tax=Pectobacterium carotovorum TaxID=554 RepID=A0A419ASC2_PECCA|nr:type III secretion system protein [Pectobacterium carotovorum]RJL48594.1 type III secretion system protein [Pectobacterium carotovorum]
MTNITSHNAAIWVQQAYKSQIDSTGSAENTAAIPKGEAPKGAVALLTNIGIDNVYNRSVMSTDTTAKPALSAPPMGAAKISAEQTKELVKLSENLQKGTDVNKLERIAASASSLVSSQINITQANNKAGETSKLTMTMESSAVNTVSSSDNARAMAPVAGGTDITAADATGSRTKMFDSFMLGVMNKIIVAANEQNTSHSRASARSVQNMVTSANNAGNKHIDAEKQRMTGAITSGSVGISGQGAMALCSVKSLKAESASLDNNLGKAINIEKLNGGRQTDVVTNTNPLASGGKQPTTAMTSDMNFYNAQRVQDANLLRNSHSQVLNATQRTRAGTEYGNQVFQSGQKVIDNGFNVAASHESKEAELARANQSVNSEVSNAHQQSAKKAAETEAAMRQMQESVLRNNNDAASAISGRMG